MGRKRKEHRNPKKRILVLCEGETEVAYFKGIKRSHRFRGKASLKVECPTKHDAKSLVDRAVRMKKEAKKERNPYDGGVWVVFDKDPHQDQEEAFKKAGENSIGIAFSSLSFEYWYLLHFKKTTRTFTDQDELMADLRKEWPGYEKTGQDHFGELGEKLPQAIENAEWLREQMDEELQDRGGRIHRVNPYVTVDQLVGELVG